MKRHLEILLLDNDCVVVPDFGGFVAYHVSAHFDETDGAFIPPKRTVGFNPQLKMNDSLLAQSYVEAYDISYPEAVQRIENEVAELRETIAREGSYTLDGIGILSCNDDGGYLFTPCESGILTPELYGLSTFSLTPAAKPAHQPADESEAVPAETKPKAVRTETNPKAAPAETKTVALPHPTLTDVMDDDEERTVRIKLSWIRNASAVAAAILLFLLMSKPVANGNYSSQAFTALEHHVVYQLAKDQPDKPATARPVAKETPSPAPAETADSVKTQPEKTAEQKTEIAPETETVPETATKPSAVQQADASHPYCLVLASRVKRSNAEALVRNLQKRGFKDAEVYEHNKMVRVVYGHFRTMGEAYDARNSLQREADFAEAWVYQKPTEV